MPDASSTPASKTSTMYSLSIWAATLASKLEPPPQILALEDVREHGDLERPPPLGLDVDDLVDGPHTPVAMVRRTR